MRDAFRTLVLLATLGVSLLASGGRASAQVSPSAPFVIEFSPQLDPFLNQVAGINAVVGTSVCGSATFPSDERRILVGGPGTPPECNQAWRVVALVPTENHPPLANDLILMPGETVVVDTIRPFPAVDGPALPPFWIEIRTFDSPITTADLKDLGQVTAFVGSTRCGTGRFDEAVDPGGLTVSIGDTGTSNICRVAGAEIALIDGNGFQLAVRPSVGPGLYYTLHDLTRDPAGRRELLPSASGNAGFAAPENQLSTDTLVVLFGVLLATLVGVRRVTRGDR